MSKIVLRDKPYKVGRLYSYYRTTGDFLRSCGGVCFDTTIEYRIPNREIMGWNQLLHKEYKQISSKTASKVVSDVNNKYKETSITGAYIFDVYALGKLVQTRRI